MLKVYAVESLRAGMTVGRDIVDEQGNALISTGTMLTKEMIYGLLDRPIFSVYIDEQEPPAMPSKENLLDDDYIVCYNTVYQQLERMFEGLVQRGEFNAADLQNIMNFVMVRRRYRRFII